MKQGQSYVVFVHNDKNIHITACHCREYDVILPDRVCRQPLATGAYFFRHCENAKAAAKVGGLSYDKVDG